MLISIQIVDYPALFAFWLSFSRWIAVIIQLPLFDGMQTPHIVKVLVALVVTYAFFPITEPHVLKDISYLGEDSFWILTLFNTLVGLALGLFVRSLMSIFIASGAMITQQIGFSAISYFDPVATRGVGPFEKIIQWTMIAMILSSGALLPMFKGIIGTFNSIHIYDIGKLASSPIFFRDLFKSIFLSSLLLASPLIFTNVLVMTLLGIISRVVPQMNIIMISFVLNIGLGLLVFFTTADEFFRVGFSLYTEHLGRWFQFVI